jgi:hypothetical protein
MAPLAEARMTYLTLLLILFLIGGRDKGLGLDKDIHFLICVNEIFID